MIQRYISSQLKLAERHAGHSNWDYVDISIVRAFFSELRKSRTSRICFLTLLEILLLVIYVELDTVPRVHSYFLQLVSSFVIQRLPDTTTWNTARFGTLVFSEIICRYLRNVIFSSPFAYTHTHHVNKNKTGIYTAPSKNQTYHIRIYKFRYKIVLTSSLQLFSVYSGLWTGNCRVNCLQ